MHLACGWTYNVLLLQLRLLQRFKMMNVHEMMRSIKQAKPNGLFLGAECPFDPLAGLLNVDIVYKGVTIIYVHLNWARRGMHFCQTENVASMGRIRGSCRLRFVQISLNSGDIQPPITIEIRKNSTYRRNNFDVITISLFFSLIFTYGIKTFISCNTTSAQIMVLQSVSMSVVSMSITQGHTSRIPRAIPDRVTMSTDRYFSIHLIDKHGETH
jgi:hypothetical protein